jgi:hypothetical protein
MTRPASAGTWDDVEHGDKAERGDREGDDCEIAVHRHGSGQVSGSARLSQPPVLTIDQPGDE